MAGSIRRPRPVVVAQALLALGCAAYVVQAIAAVCGAMPPLVFETHLYPGLLAGAGALCLTRAVRVADERAPWVLLGVGLLLWAAGDAYATAVLLDHPAPPLWSAADALWLAFYPAAYAALVVLARRRLSGNRRALWLDGAIGAGAIGALGAALMLSPLIEGLAQAPAVVAADLTYLLADLLLIAFVVMILALTGWAPRGSWTLLVSALAMIAAADALSVYEGATGANLGGTAFAVLAPIGALLLAAAAWRGHATSGAIAFTGWRLLAMPAVFAVIALAVVVAATVHAVNAVAVLLAIATLAAVIVRMTLTYADNMRVLAQSREEALTDALTSLGNRRRLLDDLERACADEERPHTLLLLDLDQFKRYNDSFGHPAGDALLAQIGSRLRETVGPWGTAYRLGGDEFCVLLAAAGVDAEDLRDEVLEAATQRGVGFTVGASCGAIEVPTEARDSTVALQIADQRLYARKASRRAEATHEMARDVLLQAIHECEPELSSHSTEVAGVAGVIATRMGLETDEIGHVERAAELHDVGKVAVPDSVLGKPGALDEAEWSFMRQHTIIGQRILAVAPALHPIAELVRSSHEHFDGGGYPDGLVGEEIPLGARIIAVCDAYDAMVSDRPYRGGLGHAEALAELRRCSGTQFDPRVVEAFCEAIGSLRHGQRVPALV